MSITQEAAHAGEGGMVQACNQRDMMSHNKLINK
jgi:hypothetical protein